MNHLRAGNKNNKSKFINEAKSNKIDLHQRRIEESEE